jgi:hypothetical protein
MNTSWKSDMECPECGKQLVRVLGMGDEAAVTLCCQFGPCKVSEVGRGETEEDAFADLERNIEKSGRSLQ